MIETTKTSDEELVESCLEGSTEAWEALVDRYQRLVWAIVTRRGVGEADVADVFQSIWVDVFNDLGQVRNRRDVRPWLSSIAVRKCSRWHRDRLRAGDGDASSDTVEEVEEAPWLEDLLRRDAMLRSVERLSPRCQELVRLLFFAEPPMPYQQVAEQLGLAVGSIGFIRGRCLEKLKAVLEEEGLW
ncbi:MAG: sigma-70 family RNA polymerase sigma factor [Acidobacteriota bacterium]